jgi:ubiquinone/menaquinone biosynthesis C-methylase UbiE
LGILISVYISSNPYATIISRRGIRQLLPRYDEMLEVITRCLPSTSRRILELGCGTGELSLKILNRFPDAQVIASIRPN